MCNNDDDKMDERTLFYIVLDVFIFLLILGAAVFFKEKQILITWIFPCLFAILIFAKDYWEF